jgi:hypothetical protein
LNNKNLITFLGEAKAIQLLKNSKNSKNIQLFQKLAFGTIECF